MTQENLLIYPTVDLFLYDLADGLGQTDSEVNQNRQHFWQKVYGDNLTPELLAKLKIAETNANYIDLLGDKLFADFESAVDGYYYPVKLGDTYALQIDSSGNAQPPEKQLLPQDIRCLEAIRKEICDRTHGSNATIGQSWLIWGQLTANDQDALATAQNCYREFKLFENPKWESNLQNKGEFLGANFYELWQPPSDREDISTNRHLLICLFPHTVDGSISAAVEIMTLLYPDFIQLFRFRNKVIWAYQQSRQLKSDLKKAAVSIQNIVDKLPQQVTSTNLDLKHLQKNLVRSLTIFAIYANYISRLEEQENTIKTNLKNYKKRVEKIATDRKSNPDALLFLKSFSDFASEKYVAQVKSDRASLTAGLRLLENAIETIKGIIDIEQTKSDRALNATIAIVGIGLATSGVAASIVSTQVSNPTTPANAMPPYPAFWLSVAIGIFPVAIGMIFLAIKRSFRR